MEQVAGARHHALRDPIILRLAPSPDVLRDCQGRLLDKYEVAVELERPHLLLQIRPHRREVRADPGPGPGQIPGREEARQNAGVQGLAGVGGRGRQRPLLRRGPGAGLEGSSWPRGTAVRVRGGEDCVICAFNENLEVLQPRCGRGERGLPSPPQGAPGSTRISAGRARGAGPPVQALRGPDHRDELDHIVPVPRAPLRGWLAVTDLPTKP